MARDHGAYVDPDKWDTRIKSRELTRSVHIRGKCDARRGHLASQYESDCREVRRFIGIQHLQGCQMWVAAHCKPDEISKFDARLV